MNLRRHRLSALLSCVLCLLSLALTGAALASWTITTGTTVGNVTYLNTVALTGTYNSGGVTVDTVYGGVYDYDGSGPPITPPGILADEVLTDLGNSVYGWNLDFTGITIGNWVYSVQLQAYNSVTGVRSGVTTMLFVYDTVPPTLPSNYLICNPSVVVKGITPESVLLVVYAVDSLSPVLDNGFYLTATPAGANVTTVATGGDAATPPGNGAPGPLIPATWRRAPTPSPPGSMTPRVTTPRRAASSACSS